MNSPQQVSSLPWLYLITPLETPANPGSRQAGLSLPICQTKKLSLNKEQGLGPGHPMAEGAGLRLRPQGGKTVPSAESDLES